MPYYCPIREGSTCPATHGAQQNNTEMNGLLFKGIIASHGTWLVMAQKVFI